MLALRRASLPLRSRGLSARVSSAFCAYTGQLITQTQYESCIIYDSSESAANRCLTFAGFYRGKHASANLFLARRGLASHAGAKSRGDDGNLDDGFSELETEDAPKAGSGDTSQDEGEDELISEPDLSEHDDDVAEISDAEGDPNEKLLSKKRQHSEVLKAVIAAQGPAVNNALDKWVAEGNVIDRDEIPLIMITLRKYRMYGKALQFSEWLETSKTIEFTEKDYSTRLSLINKVHGLVKAENYIDRIPVSLRGEILYRTLLACCVRALNSKKAKEVFNKIKDEFTLTEFACNQMILLYKRIDHRKIADVLLLMEKESIKPSIFTYSMLIDIKGLHGDITEMEQVLESMKSEGVEPDNYIKYIVARHYASAGFKEKAEAVTKEIEGDSGLGGNRHACQCLIRLYGDLGLADEVERVWNMCEENNPWPAECMAAIDAWGKLKRVDKAEAVFEKMLGLVRSPNPIHYNALLKAYTSNKMLGKGKDLIKQMAEKGFHIGPVTWDSLVRLYVEAGEVGRADSVLHKVAQQGPVRPLFVSYMTVMDEYAKRGDTHNTEKMFHRMREVGYQPRIRQFQTLVRAYVNAKAPLYGMRERMKADNVFPTKGLSGQLELVNAFRKTSVSDLLD